MYDVHCSHCNVFSYYSCLRPMGHPGLTRVRSIRFLLFEIKFGLWGNNLLIYGFAVLYFFIKNVRICRQRKYLRKKAKKMFNGSNCDRKSQLSGILTEPLNPRGVSGKFIYDLKDCLRNFKWPSIQRMQCSIHNLSDQVWVIYPCL